MAHQSKFVSVNLNKSYGQPPSLSSSSAFGHGRARPGAAGGGSGMVVLSRPRSSGSAGQKGPPKLSVPPPLNLPSRRKEHERFDPSSAPGSSARPGSSGLGSGGGSSTMGWTKTGLFQDRDDGAPPSRSGDPRMDSTYKPPGARSGGQLPLASSPSQTVEKAVILRGEDFPTLRATAITGMKQKDTLNQKQKPKQLGEEVAHGRTERPELQAPLDMRPHMRSSRLPTGAVSEKDEGLVRLSGSVEQPRKQDGYFPGPLPVVRLSHTSNWADDERDTGLSIPERERDRDHGFSRIVSARDTEGASVMSKEFFRGDSFGRHLATPRKDVRDVSSWRTSQPRDGSGFPETGVNRDRNGGKPFGVNREMNKESNNSHLPHADTARDGFSNGGTFDTRYSRKDVGSGTSIQNGRNVADAFNGRVVDQNQHRRYGDLSNNRYRGDTFQNSISKNPFSSGSKGFSLNDLILNFGREKRLISKSEKPYLENSVLDSSDPFSGGFIGEVNAKMLKRKKDALKQADFIDPVRESFEAELERVQRMQEMERQRVMEEQARALELARREQEERERLAREEEERRRLLEEEAREAAWRAEQERMEAARRAEEQKIAREEERRRILLEEERRKEAARQKLLDLEARIAKRQAEVNLKDERFPSAVVDERVSSPANGRDVPRAADLEEWEDGERMVEHITSMTSSDSSSMNRYFDIGYGPHCSRDGNSPFMERGKNVNNWRRDAYDNGNSSMFLSQDQDNDYHNSRRDAFSSGRGFSRKEILGNIGPSVRSFSKGGTSEALQVPDDLRHSRGSKWNIAVDGDYFNRNSEIDAEFLDNDKFGDAVWGPGRSRGSPHASYAERSYQNSEADGFSSFGRSRHSLRQPRVFPPPSMSSMRKSPFGTATEHPSSSSFLDSEMRYHHAGKAEEGSYNSAYQERLQQPGTTALAENTIPSEQIENKNSLRCDSQSSLSVSSPPTSPTHLSHDDLDESEDSQAPSTSAVGEQIVLSDNEHIVSALSALEAEDTNIVPTSTSVSHGEDDEWPTEKHETMQEQEEYDEDDDGYREEEEAHEGNGENLDLGQEFEDVQSDVPDKSGEADQIVLGFDEGVELQIPINDEFETTPRNSEETIGFKAGSVGATEELICSEGDMVESDNAFRGGIVNDSSNIINETEKALQDLTLDPVPSTSYTPDSVEASSSGMLAQEPVSSTLSSLMSSTCLVQPIVASVSTVASQPEVPIKLHFGLFSGPSLIPSPVPAIQIGSIQMPLHLHPQVGPSMTQMHSSQPPFFQFGQLRYPSPISQGILPLAPQTMSFVQPPASVQYSLNQNLGGSAHNQASQESSSLNNSGDKVVSTPSLIDNQPGLVTRPFDVSQDNIESRQMHALPDSLKNEVASRSQNGGSSFVEVKSKYVSASQSERHDIHDVTVKKNYRPVVNNKESPLHAEHNPSQFFSGEKLINESRAAGMVSGSRGKRFAYTVRNAGSRSSFSATEASHTDSGGFQWRARRNIRRTEFRVREYADRRQIEAAESFNNAGQDGKPNFIVKVSGNSARYGGKKDTGLNQSTKMAMEPEKLSSGASSGRVVISGGKKDKVSGKDSSKKRISSLENYHSAEGNTKRNGSSEEDVDAPLQSGVVRVFKQPGIEAPSDEDDFIQVRSKRQMLNDRREQREKELKAKSRLMKAPRKPRAVHQSNAVTSKSNKTVGGDATNIVHPGSGSGRAFTNVESSPVFTANITSPSLPPIGTPAVNVDSDPKSSNSLKSCQKNSMPPVSSVGTKLIPVLPLDNKNGVSDDTSMPFGSWCNADINQQVMALTQSQLDEAMQPARFDSHAASSIAHEPIKPSTSITMQEKSFSSSASSLNSLLAGEKIQFGAVTSPTVLPPVSRTLSNGIGPPGSGRSDVAMASKLPATEKDCAVFFDKDKHPDETCAHLEDPEAEAEAAASAVAVAAISNNDEIVGNRLSACSVSISDTNNFSGSDATLLTLKGVAPSQEVTGQLAVEESLTVSLPADLSVDTPSLPLWPPLPNPQSSSSPMLSHFPAAPPSHFPCFEMNPMLGGPIFAFGPHDESAGTQGQPQRSTTIGSGPLGAWPQWHSPMDSFYGPPAGFTGPFISPGGIPGVQGPPHMVVYNHFAPVGPFGQVGLSFMGTTYIPTGKQPDWKHNPVSSAVGVSESDMSNLNVVSGSHNPSSMPTPIQHMAPGSSLMPMASPLTMFDMSFQSSADIPLQARWSHIPAPPIHSVPLSVPLQQHQADRMPSQFNRGLPLDPSAGNNRFNERCLSTVADGNRSLLIQKDAAPQFLHELGLVEPSPSTNSVKTIGPSGSSASGNDSKGSKCSKSSTNTVVKASESGGNGTSSSNSEGQSGGPSSKHLTQQQLASSGQQFLHPIGHADQRGGGTSQKIVSGGEWHRRMGYQGRNQTSGADKNFASSKVKQIYVAKLPTSGPAATG